MANKPPAVGTTEDGYMFMGGDPSQQASWKRVQSESEQVATRPGQTAPMPNSPLSHPAMPGVSSRYAGPQSKALTQKMRESRNLPRQYATDAAIGAMVPVLPEAIVPGITGSVLGGAATGAGTYMAEKGVRGQAPDLKGTGIAAATGGIAGPLLEWGGGRLLGKILGRTLGRTAGDVVAPGAEATTAGSGGALAERIAAERDAERLIRTPDELAGMEQAGRAEEAATQLQRPRARLRGMIYGGRGTPPRVTNEEMNQ